MEKELSAPCLSQPGTCQEVFQDGERVLLTVSARWLQLEGDSPGVRRINRYYQSLSEAWKRRWAGPLLERAKAAATPDSPPWEARLDLTVTLLSQELLSLRWDVVEDVGLRRPRRLRTGDTWLLPQGTPVTLRELLPPRRLWKKGIVEEVRRQIGRRVEAGESVFYEDWHSLAARKFSPGRFYLTGDGPVVFYPVETIAPAMEGFPSFPLKPAVE